MFSFFNKRKKRGFSVLEIITGVTIMTILAGLTVPMFYTSRSSAMNSKVKQELDSIAGAMRNYYIDKLTLADVSPDGTLTKLNQTRYISVIPEDPWGQNYKVGLKWVPDGDDNPTTGTIVFVASSGPDGTFQTILDRENPLFDGEIPSGSDDVVLIVLKIE